MDDFALHRPVNRLLREFISGKLVDDAPVVEDQDAVTDFDEIIHAGRGNERAGVLAESVVDAVQDAVFRLNIDSPRRFVKQAHFGALLHDTSDQDLLFVAAGELLDLLCLGGDLDIELINAAGGRFFFPAGIQYADPGQAGQNTHRQVLADRGNRNQSLRLPLLREVDDSLFGGLGGRREAKLSSAELHCSAVQGIRTDDTAENLGPAAAAETGDSDDFTLADRKIYIAEAPVAGEALK